MMTHINLASRSRLLIRNIRFKSEKKRPRPFWYKFLPKSWTVDRIYDGGKGFWGTACDMYGWDPATVKTWLRIATFIGIGFGLYIFGLPDVVRYLFIWFICRLIILIVNKSLHFTVQ